MNDKIYTWKEIIDGLKSPHNTFVLVSKRNTGKSKSVRNIIVELLQKIKHHNIFLFSETSFDKVNDDYEFLWDSPFTYVFDGTKEGINENITGVLTYCKEQKAKNKNFSALVIFDDIDVSERNSKVSKLFTQGRHYNMNIIVSAQSASYFLDPTKRGNVDYLTMGIAENSMIKKFYESMKTQMSLKEFNEFLDDSTEDYQFLLYDNTVRKKDDALKFKKVKAILYDEIEVVETKKSKK